MHVIQAVALPVAVRTSVGDGMLTAAERKKHDLITRSHGYGTPRAYLSYVSCQPSVGDIWSNVCQLCVPDI